MKYAKPTVISSNTNNIVPRGNCWGFTCESTEVFVCSSEGFKCSFGFKCTHYR